MRLMAGSEVADWRRSRLAFVLSAIFFCAAVSAQSQTGLPEGNGKALIEANCAQCHDLERVSNARFTREDWQITVTRMVAHGAVLKDDEIAVVTDYLARNFLGQPAVVIPGAEAAIEKALFAAPANLRPAATVIRWKPDQTYETFKKGTNRLVCYDRSGFPLEPPFSVECTSIGNLERVAQNLKFEAAGGGDEKKTQALFDALEKEGTRVKPEHGSIWHQFRGADQARARMHLTVAVPGGTAQSTGLPVTRDPMNAWIMDAGTSSAHIMLPGR